MGAQPVFARQGGAAGRGRALGTRPFALPRGPHGLSSGRLCGRVRAPARATRRESLDGLRTVLWSRLALRYALDHPEYLLAQIFTNSTSALADADWVAAMQAGAEQQADAIERGGLGLLEKLPLHPVQARRLPSGAHEALIADAPLLDPPGAARAIRYTVPDSSFRDRVRENRVPTLLVCGERESRFASHRTFAEQHLPHLEVAGVDAGDAVNIAASQAFDTAVTAFAKRAGSS